MDHRVKPGGDGEKMLRGMAGKILRRQRSVEASAPSTAQERGPPPPLSRGRISDIVLAMRLCIRALPKVLRTASPEGRRSADRRTFHWPHHTLRRCRLKVLRMRQRSQRRPLAFRRSTAALAAQINATAQPRPRFARLSGRRRYLRHKPRLQRCTSRAGRYAGGSMPGPPGSGVTSPARRNRTRPIARLSPVDAPSMGRIFDR